jgi:predicted nucleic acid-binding protein
MAVAFLDSSALTRRYYQAEPGANRVRELCAPSRRNVILLSRLAPVELSAALNRQVREGTLSPERRARQWWAFRVDWRSQYTVVAATEAVFESAEALVARYPLHTLDAIHVASALAAAQRAGRSTFQFWTADRQQAEAARREGLQVEIL